MSSGPSILAIRQLNYLFLPPEPSSEKACLSLGEPSDKVNPVEVDSLAVTVGEKG